MDVGLDCPVMLSTLFLATACGFDVFLRWFVWIIWISRGELWVSLTYRAVRFVQV